ncbi:MAG: hypothetical protein U1F77_15495 [Kiritimatiellia bacterium]
MSAIREVQSAWRTAANELGFAFVAPFEIEDGSESVQFHGHVRDFGSPKGAVFLVCETFREDVDRPLSVAKIKGYFHSQISADVYRIYDRDIFLEALRDWGWFGAEADRPSWV